MRLFYLSVLVVIILLLPWQVSLADCSINSYLYIGSRGIEVQCLQGKVGTTQDGSFGPITRNAVMIFQSNHSLAPDGFVGPLTRGALNNDILSNITPPPQNIVPNPPVNNVILSPKVLSVFPDKVRSGDTVTIKGENFSTTGNTARFIFGMIEDKFDNLSSSDGKTISFVYQPPNVKTMSKDEILNSSSDAVKSLLSVVQNAGGSVDDIVAPYRNMENESDLQRSLSQNGQSFDNMYDTYYIEISNASNQNSLELVSIKGLRKLLYSNEAERFLTSKDSFLNKIFSFFDIFSTKKAYAQIPEGGTNSGIIMYCTCGDGYLTYMVDFSTNQGSGIYWWSSSFVPVYGSPMIAGSQLGFYIKNAGQCSIYAGVTCTSITANVAVNPWGN